MFFLKDPRNVQKQQEQIRNTLQHKQHKQHQKNRTFQESREDSRKMVPGIAGEEKTKAKNFHFVVAGGVAANNSIRENILKLSKEIGFKAIFPDIKFCGDNAAMIACGLQILIITNKENLFFQPGQDLKHAPLND